jgi:hypothetical protein
MSEKMPMKIELGLFYAPAPMSEYYYSVIGDETKMVPESHAKYHHDDKFRALESDRDKYKSRTNELYEVLKNKQQHDEKQPERINQTLSELDEVVMRWSMWSGDIPPVNKDKVLPWLEKNYSTLIEVLSSGSSDKINALEAEVERLRGALENLVDMDDRDNRLDPDCVFTDKGREDAFKRARQALEGK